MWKADQCARSRSITIMSAPEQHPHDERMVLRYLMVKTYHPVWTITYTPGSCSVNISGTWRKGEPWVNVSGTWRKGVIWTNISGTWKQGK